MTATAVSLMERLFLRASGARLSDSQANLKALENERSCFAKQNRAQPKSAQRSSEHPAIGIHIKLPSDLSNYEI